MITLIFQIFLWLLATFLIGLLIGWLVRPFFCKKGKGRTANAGDHSFINRSTGQNTAEIDSGASLVGSSNSRKQHIAAANEEADFVINTTHSDNENGSFAKNAAVATAGLSAAATATYAASNNDDGKQSAEATAKAQIEANRQRAREEAQAANAEKTKRDAEQLRLREAETARLAAERAEVERVAAEQKHAAEDAAKKQAHEVWLAKEQAAATKEADRVAAQAEAKRLADEEIASEIEADRLRLIEEQKRRDVAEAAHLAEEQRLADEIEQDRLQLIEQQRQADEREKRTAERAEAERLAEEHRVSAQKAEEVRLAKAKLAAEEAEAERLAAEKAEADRLEEKKRITAEKAEADRLAKEKQLAEEAETKRIAAEKAEADRLAEEKRIATEKTEADRLAKEKQLVEEVEAKRIATEKAEADRLAEEKRIVAEKTEAKSSNTGAIAAAGIASLAAATASSASNNDANDISDHMRPARLTSPKGGNADDLKEIRGIGPAIEKTLNTEGVYHFQQIAEFTPDNVRWVDKNISIPGRVDRDDWIGQARALSYGESYQGFAYDPDSAVVTDEMRPQKLNSPTGGAADDLKRIKGIGPVIEGTLNDEGIYHFQQIADFTPQNTMWVDKHISFPGHIQREDWIGQAKSIIDGRQYSGHAAVSDEADSSTPEITNDMRPARQRLKPNQKSDDLKVINGIGPVIEESLNDEGVYFYQQIADFTDENAHWVDNHMAFPGRIHREDWIGQAKVLVGDNSASITDDMKPTLLSKPGAGGAEDLKRIKGIGKVLEKRLHKLGIYHYDQVAELTDANILWLTDFVSFPEGRIDAEDWVGQARTLAEGKRTDYSDRFDSGETPYK